METLSDIFKNIRERLANPFIFSFVIAWIILNWQVTVALFWYDPIQIRQANYKNIFDLIYHETNYCQSVWYPLGSAVLYTFVMPFFKVAIELFQSWIGMKGTNLNIELTKESNLPISMFLQLKGDYQKRTELLESTLKEQEKNSIVFEAEKTLRMSSEKELAEAKNNIAKQERYIDLLYERSILEGVWACILVNKNKQPFNFTIEFTHEGHGYIQTGKQKHFVFRMTDFLFDSKKKEVFFIKYINESALVLPEVKSIIGTYYSNSNTPLINRLKIIKSNSTIMEGTENMVSIRYTKILPEPDWN